MLPVHLGGVPIPARRTVLFLIAILLPCGVLVALTALMMGQQRELRERRLTDKRRAITAAASSELASQLERLRVQALTGRHAQTEAPLSNGMVALVAPLEAGHLRLPWETEPNARASESSGDAFQQAMRDGERAENTGAGDVARTQFQHALAAARSPSQAAAARLGLARALTATGRLRDATLQDAELLRTSLAVRDDQGIPFALYGAHRLTATVRARPGPPEILAALRASFSVIPPLPPAALYAVHDIAKSLGALATDEGSRAAARTLAAEAVQLSRDREQAQALAQALPTLFPPATSPEINAPWEFFGAEDNRWLVSALPAAGHVEAGVVALRFQAFSAYISQTPLFHDNGIRLIDPGYTAGDRLSGDLHGLALQMSPTRADAADREERLQQPFYVAVLLLVVGIAWWGGYFFWHDVQRELRTADMRSQFVSSVSHELKTPLTAIRMFAETLLMGRSRPETRQEYLQTIVNESERLTRLINNVLDFSKIEQGTKIYRMEPQELTEIVESVARVLEYPLLQQGFALHLDLQRGITVLADHDAMQQALLNLLSNAMKYSGDSRTILLTLSASHGEACVSVVDRGCGIPSSELGRIFQKFYRAERAQQEHIPGTGLGLTIVEHVVAAHGGRVAVTSTPGNGSTFSLILPVHRIEPEPRPFDPSLGQAHASHSRH